MNMKEAFLCPLCLLCCVINLQILLPSKSRHKPFCNKGRVTRHVCFLCISFAWPSGIEPRSLALFNLTYSLLRSPLPLYTCVCFCKLLPINSRCQHFSLSNTFVHFKRPITGPKLSQVDRVITLQYVEPGMWNFGIRIPAVSPLCVQRCTDCNLFTFYFIYWKFYFKSNHYYILYYMHYVHQGHIEILLSNV